MIIKVGARASPLSRVQVQEVLNELLQHRSDIEFDNIFLETFGDIDRTTSLRTLGKTDFFTREVDNLLLNNVCRIGIHSAKDLPDPMDKQLVIAALTKGLDSSDVLVMREGESVETLLPGAIIATSSIRREEAVKSLRNDFQFIDVRGTVEERLMLLHNRHADGVVIAEAALLRLGLNLLNRIRLPGESTPLQGQLAVVCRRDDHEMIDLFANIHYAKKKHRVLYLGIELPENTEPHRSLVHYPIIRVQCRPKTELKHFFEEVPHYTHLLFTSKNGVHLFFQTLTQFKIPMHCLADKQVLCVGHQTGKAFQSYGISNPLIAKDEKAEGLIELMEAMALKDPYLFWPHSALSRPLIIDYFHKKQYRYKDCVLYDTIVNTSLPAIDLAPVDEIYFTSPSTVDAFIQLFGRLPPDKSIKSIGSITEEYLVKIGQLIQNEK